MTNRWEASYLCMGETHEVHPYIYISSEASAEDETTLIKYDIAAVLRLQIDSPLNESNLYNKHGIDYYQIYMLDDQEFPIKKYFPVTNSIIKMYVENKKNILVHCGAGISRSPTIVAGYLLATGIVQSSSEAIKYLEEKRWIVDPNKGFRRQLLEYEQELRE